VHRRVLTEAMATGGDVDRRAFEAMMDTGKVVVAGMEAALRGQAVRGCGR
jgi:predicted 3-demethylubiquinone-9 3-methyltransferase (glyoxalase superfamily)